MQGELERITLQHNLQKLAVNFEEVMYVLRM